MRVPGIRRRWRHWRPRRLIGPAAALLIACAALPAAGQASRFSLSIGAGWESIAAYGSESDYVLMENDFPRTPPHTVWTATAAVTFDVSPAFALRLEGRRAIGTPLRLTDPSDGDEAEIDSAARWAASLDLRYRFGGRRIRPWLCAGAGVERLTAQRQVTTTRLGFAAVFEPPDDPVNIFVLAGAGASAGIAPHWSVWAELRYVHAFGAPHDTDSGLLLAGLAYTF